MPIHPKVKCLYEKHYNIVDIKDAPEEAVAVNQADERFLEEISEIIYSLENIVKRHVHGRSH